MLTESLQQLLVWPNENWRSGASDHPKKYKPEKKNKKSPRGIRPCRYSPSPQVTKYAMVTQDMSPRGKAEICDKDLFGRTKTGGLGQVTRKKN